MSEPPPPPYRSTGAPASDGEPVSYPSYLELDELLSLQHPRSSPEHDDELLFIVVHQSSELWFKAILHDLDGLVQELENKSAAAALWRVQRVNAMMRIVSSQLSALDALPPQHFAQFRGYLGTSSGSQSVQFRAIEAASGRREPHFLQVIQEHGPVPPQIQKWLDRPTLEELFLNLIAAEGMKLDDLYLGPGPSVSFFLAEALLEYEQQFAEWRFKHVQLVERIIGPATEGTGGTLGARYLRKTVDQKFFPELWAVRARFFGGRGGS